MRVRISFDRPRDLVIELTPAQLEASRDEYSWEDFYELMYDTFAEHFAATCAIEEVKELG